MKRSRNMGGVVEGRCGGMTMGTLRSGGGFVVILLLPRLRAGGGGGECSGKGGGEDSGGGSRLGGHKADGRRGGM